MSAPAREQPGTDGPLLYAPRKVRRLQPAGIEQSNFTSAPPTAPELEPARASLPRSRLQRFEGDAAIKDLRGRLSRDPDLAPQPPVRAEASSAGQWIGGWSFALIMAAIAIGTLLMVSPLSEVFRAESSARPASPVTSQREFAEEPLALGPSLDNTPGTDQSMDTQIVRLEWTQHRDQRSEALPEPAKPPQAMRSLDAETLAMLEHFLKYGDIVSARILLRRVAGNGNGQAALELGMTYDPIFLAERGVHGFPPDPGEARSWYERAMALGSAEASRNLERLKGMEK